MEKFDFTGLVKLSAKEAWEDRPTDWSSNCTIENKINNDGREYVEIENRSAGSFRGSSTDHEIFDAFMNEIFGLCKEHHLDNQGNQNYLVYDDGEYEVICHTNYDFWVPRFYSMKMVKKCDPKYIFEEDCRIIASIASEAAKEFKKISSIYMNGLDRLEKLHDKAKTPKEEEMICNSYQCLMDVQTALLEFVKTFTKIHSDSNERAEKIIYEGVVDHAINNKFAGTEILSEEDLNNKEFMDSLKEKMAEVVKSNIAKMIKRDNDSDK